MSLFPLKPKSTYIKHYYETLKHFQEHGHTTEGNMRSAFADLLKRCCAPYDWHLIEEYQFKGTAKQSLRADGALVDGLTLVHGLWEAKDSSDDLTHEIKLKVANGYPLTNILFQSPERAILYQNNRPLDRDITDPEKLIEILQLFCEYSHEYEADWETSVLRFSDEIPKLAQGVTEILNAEYNKNVDFRQNFRTFAELCRQSINPELTDPAIQKMLVQHLLTERIFRKVFNNQEFLTRNVIAAEIEKVIHSITAKHFSRDTFLRPLDRFYAAIEKAAEFQTGYTEKQYFLNRVYEKFFRSFDQKQSETHGIVYTPQPIVEFMVHSVEELLTSEFGRSLSDEEVHILDPFTGTGNFITRIMRQIKRSRLKHKYGHELHCNEIMLLPYYIASMNIEHAYLEAVDQYESFDGICLVDTFELAEPRQPLLFTTENTERVRRQKASRIKVIIANPPYRAKQVNEGDDNKNRSYKFLDLRIRDTYSKDSRAQLRSQLRDPYVRAFRWASDRIGEQGIVAYITNNSFLDQIAFDGMRKHLLSDFSKLFILDLGGNVRKNTKLSGTTHNVFGIQVGVCISILVKHAQANGPGKLLYARMPEFWKRYQKEDQLRSWGTVASIPWQELRPDNRNQWLNEGIETDWDDLIPLKKIVKSLGPGLKTNRDRYVFNFDAAVLAETMGKSVVKYLSKLAEFQFGNPRPSIAVLTPGGDKDIKWSVLTKKLLKSKVPIKFDEQSIRICSYRPFTSMFVYFDPAWIDRPGKMPTFFPSGDTQNTVVAVTGIGVQKSLQVLATNATTEHQHAPNGQCFARYVFDEDGHRKDNITNWALSHFQAHYRDSSLTKSDIFHAIYALLHHPEYRKRYAANLRRELPRIPLPADLKDFVKPGKRLIKIHVDYEQQPEYPLEEIENRKVEWTLRVKKTMSLKKNKTDLFYNDSLTLRGIPPAVFDYRLGNRSALEWVIDQYRVSTDSRSGITNDPNRPDDERYIIRLIGQVITVSLETLEIVAALPTLNFSSHVSTESSRMKA